MDSPIESVPSIGKVLGQRLRDVGITTRGELLAAGDDKAFALLKHALPEDACTHTRLALAGAVRGVHHRDLEPELKSRLTAAMHG
ncbi:MAG TPA: TfoX/Sxy family DNA transformation protein [Allosphingosinicella sp.]|uniref:TfoX/Sxy family DNA transformation protein n=1 Tax=Allosphingosinicella sp. TaxID=2823234 RepID=UPI002ED9D729